jgi:hypothetical protein
MKSSHFFPFVYLVPFVLKLFPARNERAKKILKMHFRLDEDK